VTPDRFVNKGPNRPAFNEELRAEAISALDCVDYVAINKWPMAVETIRCLRPNFYVKGAEYKDATKDSTGGITLEEQAMNSVSGDLVFTEDITFSSSRLVNRYLPVFPREVSDYLAAFSARYGPGDVLRYLEAARSLKVLVVGEAIIDEYHYCEAIGKSSKEPMLAVRHLSEEKFAGGILAVGNHVASFCDRVGLVTSLGSRHSQEEFIRSKLKPNIEATFLCRKDSPTIVKRRFVESYFFTKLLEVYEMNDGALDDGGDRTLCSALSDLLPEYDVVIVVDFGHGMLSKDAVGLLTERSRFLAVNAQSNAGNLGYHTISRYPRADYVCVAEKEIRLEARDRQGDLKGMIREVGRRLICERVAVTRGRFGCLCYSDKEGFVEVPALATEVVDRMGAGDAFFSVTALSVAQDAPMEVVGFIGNAVGAQAVATVGHRTPVERKPLFRHIEYLLK
jgi:bifunctional ADP-heptose synthase (sugar kinase/adenylyltransferase)